jgi:glycosyltransferase domain-containing protein
MARIMKQTPRLSLVVPTYRRQDCAIRTMEFWSGHPVVVYVLDGSDRPIDSETILRIGPNIHYHHLRLSVAERLGWVAGLIDTEYVALLGDDEFFLPSALAACVEELDRAPELVSCMGRCLGFSVERQLVLGWPAYTEMAGYDILQDDPIERMVHHMNPYTCSTIYSVVRTPAWSAAMAILPKTQIHVLALEEIEFELAIAYQGKCRVLPVLQWMRNYQESSIGDSQVNAKVSTTFVHWWRDGSRQTERSQVLDVMTEALAKGDKSQVHTIRCGVERALETFFEYSLSKNQLPSQLPRPATLAGRLRLAIRSRLPSRVVAGVVAIRGALHDRSRAKPRLLSAAKNLEAGGVSIDLTQLLVIERLLLAYYARDKSQTKALFSA